MEEYPYEAPDEFNVFMNSCFNEYSFGEEGVDAGKDYKKIFIKKCCSKMLFKNVLSKDGSAFSKKKDKKDKVKNT